MIDIDSKSTGDFENQIPKERDNPSSWQVVIRMYHNNFGDLGLSKG